ncbi:hypothetical protein Nepgr_006605 [Nepenthes gracilis]|uniref:Uncharacterized protein n=1 Tax=Nepenthes gracilis TaxID=150966 RepID=A0AAD3S5G3_NEPGR|nr:hypothetical protein Nepgr_006605 [Nepenthes gracilis]
MLCDSFVVAVWVGFLTNSRLAPCLLDEVVFRCQHGLTRYEHSGGYVTVCGSKRWLTWTASLVGHTDHSLTLQEWIVPIPRLEQCTGAIFSTKASVGLEDRVAPRFCVGARHAGFSCVRLASCSRLADTVRFADFGKDGRFGRIAHGSLVLPVWGKANMAHSAGMMSPVNGLRLVARSVWNWTSWRAAMLDKPAYSNNRLAQNVGIQLARNGPLRVRSN